MQKHAYLILAHNEFELLEKLVKFLDNEKCDIYIHLDKKVNAFDFDGFVKNVKYSKVTFVPRVCVKWGDISMVKAEYSLLKAALSGGSYSYIHLLSGVDVPLKSFEEIYSYFEDNSGIEFVSISQEKMRIAHYDRIRTYHFATGRRNLFNRAITKAESILAHIFNFDRAKNIQVERGSQWISITSEFAKYLVDKEDFVMKQFKYTLVPDEFFAQTVLMNSPFKDNVYNFKLNNRCSDPIRYTDWKRGAPYTFTIDDYDELVHCGCLFARKFSSQVDRQICEKLYSRVMINE